MRKPKLTRVRKSARFPDGRKYAGAVAYRGVQRWVPGAYPTATAWREAAKVVQAELERELDTKRAARLPGVVPMVPSVAVFAGVQLAEGGRVIPREGLRQEQTWPWTHTRNGKLRKESSKRRYSEAVRGFVRDYGERRMDSFHRVEAQQIAADMGQHEREAVRRLFADAIDTGYRIGDGIQDGANPFRGAGAKKKRKDDPDFRITIVAELDLLLQAALDSRSDEYSKTLHAIVLLESQSAMRPGEILGTWREDVHVEEGYIDVRWQLDDRGARTPVKNELRRRVPMSPRMIRAYLDAPHLSDRWAFSAPRGGPMKLSNWSSHWHTICTLAASRAETEDSRQHLATLEFYELKHRACTWMCTPRESGGLGVDPPTAAWIAGHQDGGKTIVKYYLRLEERAAVERVRRAMALHEGEPHLRVVGE